MRVLLVPQAAAVNSWVLGWQFSAGEFIQGSQDVFGEAAQYGVHLTQQAGQQQGVAVLSEWHRVCWAVWLLQ